MIYHVGMHFAVVKQLEAVVVKSSKDMQFSKKLNKNHKSMKYFSTQMILGKI